MVSAADVVAVAGRGGGRGGGGRGRDEREAQPANVRAAQTRRDGLGSRSAGGFGRGGGRGGSGGGGGGGGRPGGGGGGGQRREGGRGGDFGDREDFVRLKDVAPAAKPANKPFANFFKEKKEDGGGLICSDRGWECDRAPATQAECRVAGRSCFLGGEGGGGEAGWGSGR